MADPNSEEEPSIEEILSSIREIISDDEEDEEPVKEEVVESPIHEDRDDVLELTEEDLIEAEPEPEVEEPKIDMQDRSGDMEPEPEIQQPIEMESEMGERPEDIIEQIRQSTTEEANTIPSDILSTAAQTAALGSLQKLKSKMPINNPRSYDGVTLEDIVREMLHPMLREWMDDNLPPMVERIVQKELEKLARRAMDD